MDRFVLESLYEELIEFAISERFKPRISDAENMFIHSDNEKDSLGFTEWFVFNYPLDTQHTHIVDLFRATSTTDENIKLNSSFRSFFTITREDHKTFLTDIVTKKIYELAEDFTLNDGISSFRIIEVGGRYLIIGDDFHFDLSFSETLCKLLMEQYNQYVNENQPMPFEQFLHEQGHYIYKLISTVEFIHAESSTEDEEYKLYQATYLCRMNKNETIDWLMASGLPIFDDEDDLDLFIVIYDETVVAEIEWVDHRMYIQCNNPEHLMQMIHFFEANVNEGIHFFKSEVLTLDDLLVQQ